MSLLNNAENLFGKLDAERRGRINAFLAAPSVEGWGAIRDTIIAKSLRRGTIWQAVTAIDPTFPRAGGPEIAVPDALLVARAIKAATGIDPT